MNTNLIIFCVVLLIIGVVIAVYQKGRRALVRESREAYVAAIKSGNKQRALEAGRKYYSELRGGTLSLYDEQAIANDLSTIN